MDLRSPTINKFYSYFLEFYGPGGVYNYLGYRVTKTEFLEGIAALAIEKNHNFGGGDTVDREALRDAILKLREKGASK